MIESFSVPMFGEGRKLRVYLPTNRKDNKFPVLYMHDGQNVFENEEAIGGVGLELHDYLEKNDVELIVVAIDQNSRERVSEYCPWINGEYTTKFFGKPSSEGGKGKEYVEFIVNKLKPLIDSKYSTNHNETYMVGISLGALVTTYAACTYPQIFKRIAGLSSAFYRNQEGIQQLLKMADLSHLEKVYLDCGTNEGGDKMAGPFLETNKAIFDIIRQKGIEAELKVIEGAEHNYQAFKKRIPKVISYLLE